MIDSVGYSLTNVVPERAANRTNPSVFYWFYSNFDKYPLNWATGY